jgi:RNA polymerase sigma factor (sigma-70 family)
MPDSDAPPAAAQAAAFCELLRRHSQAMHAYLARRGGRDAADDLLGDVLLRAYAARLRYDERWPDPRPWLYGIARNVLREHWRRAGQGEMMPARLAVAEDPWPDVDSRLDAATRLPDLRRALSQLAEGDREVLLLVTWEALSPAEAALALGIPAGTARSRLHRARAVMRQLLSGAQDGQPTSYQEA